MFGYISADLGELSPEEKTRYGAVYCGICRQIRERNSNLARLGLSYDMAFLALLLMSLYEPEETGGGSACALHPIKRRPWVDNPYIRYGADMNVALAYYNALDDAADEGHLSAKMMAGILRKHFPEIGERYPRQCQAMTACIARLRELEEENCPNPDQTANCFGQLMAELFVYREDMWASTLRKMGMALGRFIYFADAAVDYPRDKRKKKYNPFLAMGSGACWEKWEEYLVLAMGRCTEHYEKLPLVQDKRILDNILYSGVWVELGRKRKSGKEGESR